MNELEQKIVGIISSAGDSKAKAFEALKKVKEKDFKAARELMEESKKIDIEAHRIQTELIVAEMNGGENKPEMSLLMVHAQDHYMTSRLARDMVEVLIDIFDTEEEK
ncbi:PTS lactose/cellobiose transporter subunit IIA [Peptacetobacter hominis]|uniref:PTS lactose/cellobiose transporter subunit IIA n=1 Tax=Peptacetobacter hominis TaxID=2743610 RepID=A0A544QYH6_9FIRM|nr:PTS lactose/cellobiose transporter subunit IIA [Peptacetobacter hominis]TQQ85665.1 PTS lactose/cellobiose transporter subunit IIA [Peptacetobacter hominis]